MQPRLTHRLHYTSDHAPVETAAAVVYDQSIPGKSNVTSLSLEGPTCNRTLSVTAVANMSSKAARKSTLDSCPSTHKAKTSLKQR